MNSDFLSKQSYDIKDLIAIMKMLRGEGGCPWDREQTHESIRQNMIEEAYEVTDAIDRNDPEMLCEELGDVLLQVVFHSEMSSEKGGFDFDHVADGVCRKLIERHPHVFGTVQAETSTEVLKNWDAIKAKSKHQETVTDTLKAVPQSFPALMRAQKVVKRASKSNLYPAPDYDPAAALLENVAVANSRCDIDKTALAGKILFSAVELVRSMGLDSEECLARETDRFIDAFEEKEADSK